MDWLLYTSLSQDSIHHPAHAGIHCLNCFDRRVEYAGVSNHITVGEIEDNHIVLVAVDAGDYLVSQFATVDSYPSDFQIFTLNDSTVGVESDLLSEALRNLTDKKREIILLYYFMDMNDTEIADLLKLNRSTVYRHRTSGLAFIKEFMEENEE